MTAHMAPGGNVIRALSFDMGILRAEVEKRRLQWYHDVYESAIPAGYTSCLSRAGAKGVP